MLGVTSSSNQSSWRQTQANQGGYGLGPIEMGALALRGKEHPLVGQVAKATCSAIHSQGHRPCALLTLLDSASRASHVGSDLAIRASLVERLNDVF